MSMDACGEEKIRKGVTMRLDGSRREWMEVDEIA